MPARSPALEALEREVHLLKDRIVALEESAPISVPIETLAPEPYDILKPFHAVIAPEGDEFIASFYDANVSASGATREEALANLKDILVAVFESLSEHAPSRLGPGPARQFEVLKQFIGRRS